MTQRERAVVFILCGTLGLLCALCGLVFLDGEEETNRKERKVVAKARKGILTRHYVYNE